jgi:hypothetical protein
MNAGDIARRLGGSGRDRIAITHQRNRHYPQRPPSAVVFKDADLALYDRQARNAGKLKHDAEDMATWHGMLLLIQRDRSYDPYFVQAKFKEKFGCDPPKGTIPKPIRPSPEVSAWVRSRLIAFAKSKRRAA